MARAAKTDPRRTRKAPARRVAWAGAAPATEREARGLLVKAALRCIERFGFERTSLSDIASEAGVTRPTVYAYYEGRDEILQAAMIHAADDLTDRLVDHVRRFDDPEDQAVETLLFCLREFQRYPGLDLLGAAPGVSVANRTSMSPRGLDVARHALGPIVEKCPWLRAEIDEIAEVMVRTFLSLLTVEGPRPRGERALREYLRRRVVPGLGLRRRPSRR